MKDGVFVIDISAVQMAYDALTAAKEWLDRYGEHAPIQFGGEAELSQHIHKALYALNGETWGEYMQRSKEKDHGAIL